MEGFGRRVWPGCGAESKRATCPNALPATILGNTKPPRMTSANAAWQQNAGEGMEASRHGWTKGAAAETACVDG